uniref:Uncharacterized protein n=1 Tax=Cucumis melo TaxID=3656 RepID=A0A9I9EDQ6_CUCME
MDEKSRKPGRSKFSNHDTYSGTLLPEESSHISPHLQIASHANYGSWQVRNLHGSPLLPVWAPIFVTVKLAGSIAPQRSIFRHIPRQIQRIPLFSPIVLRRSFTVRLLAGCRIQKNHLIIIVLQVTDRICNFGAGDGGGAHRESWFSGD